jgi:hypothetical protein
MTQSACYVLDAISAQAFARLEAESHEAATSPWNNRKPPTRAQMLRANWKHGHFELRPALRVKIENARGTIRSGKTPDGIPWENRMAAHYGDIVGTRGADGDPVDIFIGPFPESSKVWVINQRQNWDGLTGFDEHKVMAGFHTEEAARAAYLGSYQRGWDGLESIVPCTYAQLKWWLRNGDTSQPFTTANLPEDEGTSIMDNAVLWDADAHPVGIPMHQLVYALRREDAGAGLLLDAVTMVDLMSDPDIEALVQLDALVVEVSRMSLKMDMLKRVMESAAATVKPTEVTISDPVRARGVLQVMVLFQMSDGQTISVWFHNPDTTPAKLTPLDELISWKWMLNKKDVTIVVAPERGQELNVREVARRVMRLVERNSDTFKRANEKAAAKVKQVEELKTEIGVLEVELSDWQRKIEIVQMEQAEAPTPKERWDSARGHARAVDKAVREEVLNGPQATDMEAFRELTAMLATLRALVSGETVTETPEELRAKVDDLAVAIRAKMEEAAKAPAPAPTAAPVATPADEPAAGSVLSALGVSPDDIMAIADDGGYEAVIKDERLALKWQDVLDAAWQQRIVDVRNALGQLGWRRADGSSELAKDGHALVFVPKMVGPGRNIVAAHWEIKGVPGFFMSDALTRSAEDLAKNINMGLPQKAAEPASAAPATAVFGPDDEAVADKALVAALQGLASEIGGQFKSAKNATQQHSITVGSREFWGSTVLAQDRSALRLSGSKWEQRDGALSFLGEEPTDAWVAKGDPAGAVAKVIEAARGFLAPAFSIAEQPDPVSLDPEPVAAVPTPTVEQAYAQGKADFAAGVVRVPAQSAALMAMVAALGGPMGTAAPFLDAWLRGWDESNLARAAQAVADTPAAAASDTDAANAPPTAPTDAELQAAAEAGAEVNRISRNLADPSTKDLPKATFSGGTAKTIFLYTDADVARAVKAMHEAEEMSNFRPFNPADLKLPTAVQLGLNKINTVVLPVSDKDADVVLDGWSNGHMMDLTQRPKMVEKAIEKYFVDAKSGFIRRLPMSKIEKVETAAKSRGTQVLPISHYDYEQTVVDAKRAAKGKGYERVPVNSVVFEGANGVWVWLDAKYVAYFWKTYKGVEFFADSPEASVAVRHNGKLVGIVMPMNSKGDTSIIARAKRVTAKQEVAKDPDALTPAVVDAAYQFADATDAFKLAVAYSVAETDYSAFQTARAIDERAKALGLSVSWDVQVVVLDSVPLPGFEPEASETLIDGRRERVLDALVAAAKPFLPAGAVLDFVGDVGAAIAQLEVALDVCVTNEPINRAEGKIEQADLEAKNAEQFRRAIHFLGAGGRVLDDATSDAGGEEWETVVGTIKQAGEVIGRAVIADGDGKAMVYVGATGKQRVTYVSDVDGQRRPAWWSDDDAVLMLDWLLENIQAAKDAEAAAQAAIAAAAATPAPAKPSATGGGEPPAEPPAAPPVADEPKQPASLAEGRAALAEISSFMPAFQRKFIESAMRGEEGQYFIDKMIEMRDLIVGMPKVYEQDGKGGAAVVYLHFFKGGADWWITERDFDLDDQQQAFGMVDLGHGPELGYISIEEVTAAGAELDLHWDQKTVGSIRGDNAAGEASEADEDPNIGRRWRSPSGTMEVTGFKDGRYTTQIDDERPGLPIDADDLEQQIRDDERAVQEAEAEAKVARDALDKAGGEELLAAGFKHISGTEYGKSVQVDDVTTLRFNVKRVGGSGYPVGWMVRMSATFNNGVTGAPSQDLGRFDTAGEAIATVNAELAKRQPAGNAVRPLQPQGPDRVQWEEAVLQEMSEKLGVPNGDAQGMMEARPDDIDAAFAAGEAPAAVVARLWPAETAPAADTPAADPAKDADKAYLQTLIDGSADYFDTGILDRLEPMFEKYASDAEMQDLLTRAADAYSNAATAAAKQALGG